MGEEKKLIEWINKPISELTSEELYNEKAKLPEYRKWYELEGRRYFQTLDKFSFEPDISENEMLNFKYLQAIYTLNTFFGYHIKPAAYFETNNEKICSEVIERGGSILDMFKNGADALYCALLSDTDTDKEILLKTVERHIPF
jgi:hypothetical protein